MDDGKKLAELVIDTLDMQKVYFRTREISDLQECKRLETRLRKLAETVLHPEAKNPTLFEE